MSSAIDLAELTALCARLKALLSESDRHIGAVSGAAIVAVAVPAALPLSARRCGRPVQLRHASAELQASVYFTEGRSV